MKIITEKDGQETFIDVILDEEELEDVFAYIVVAKTEEINGQKFSIGVRRKFNGDHKDEE